MSEGTTTLLAPTFNLSVKLRARDQRLSSNGGVFLLREADERLGLMDSLVSGLHDPRRQDLIRYHLDELLRERIFSRSLGYNADDEVDLLAHDPAMRIATWNRPGERVLDERAASQPTQSRLTDILSSHKQNLEALRASLPKWIERHLRASGRGHAVLRGTLDIDSFPLTVSGSQPGARYNGYYRKKVYHPLVASFAPEGDYDSGRLGEGFVHAVLRAGNVHTANGAVRFIRTAVSRSSDLARSLDVRMDAGFTIGPVMDPMTDDGIRFIGRLKGNSVLDLRAGPHLIRPVGRPPKEGYEKVVELWEYRAERWRHAQRVILVVVEKPDPSTGQLDLFPRHFFLVTNWKLRDRTSSELLAHYRRRGTFEDRLGDLSQAISPHLSSPSFAENEVHLLLSLLSHNLLSILRAELESNPSTGWDVARLQRSVLKTAVRITKESRRLVVNIAISAVDLWTHLLTRMKKWHSPIPPPRQRVYRKRTWVPPPRHAFLTQVLKQ